MSPLLTLSDEDTVSIPGSYVSNEKTDQESSLTESIDFSSLLSAF